MLEYFFIFRFFLNVCLFLYIYILNVHYLTKSNVFTMDTVLGDSNVIFTTKLDHILDEWNSDIN